MLLNSLQQAIVVTGMHDFGLLIAGIIILAFGIIMNVVIPNRWWIVIIVIGAIIAILGFFILVFGPLW